ncbi:MAG: MBG domain-containing protein [Methylococcales bacterium]|nr:MBG domain-containing protein [Methylococcales bacterium]
MNHIHQTIWNKTLGTWIVASELAKRGKKSGSQQRNALMLPLLLFASTGLALPTGNQLVEGVVTVTKPSTVQMQINQNSQRAIVNWQSFSIAGQESVNIQQPNTNAALLNRVVGQDASAIQGRLNANGQVYLINPNGVIFGKTAQVDVGGLVASTHAISNKDFLNGNPHFTAGNALGKVINHGQIKTPDGGIVALIGEQVENTGHISTPKGTTVLAAGKTVDLDMQGDGFVEVKISEAAINAQINNQGIIQADGGQVLMTAKAAGQLLKTVINNQGIVEARGLVEKNGQIVLSGGDNGVVQVSGTLDASGPAANNTQGGDIKVSGQQIHINDGAKLDASGNAGGGHVIIGDQQSTRLGIVHSNAGITAQTLDHGKAGTIKILASLDNGAVNIEGRLDASAPKKGDGGFIDTSAAQVKVAGSAHVSTKAQNGNNGTWLIDPEDFTIATGSGTQTTSGIGANTLSSNLAGGNVTIATNDTGTGNGDIFINAVVTWAANKLTLSAHRNISINANLNGSGTAQLTLEYGQKTSGTGNYSLTNGAKISLPKGLNFSTKNGADTPIDYTVITDLGSENSTRLDDLQGINNNLSGNFVLGADIDASATSTWNLNAGFAPLGYSYYPYPTPFTGHFDGLGHTISNLMVNRPKVSNVGVFGITSATSSIRNLGLMGGSIIGYDTVGGLVGQNEGTISDVYTSISVDGKDLGLGADSVGGIVGLNHGSISNAYTSGNIAGTNDVGGLVGFNENGSINNSYATSNVTGSAQVGGLVGYNTGNITNAYATGNVTSKDSITYEDKTVAPNSAGGLVGRNNSIISNAYATGNVTGTIDVGGLVGLNEVGSITNAYSTGSVTGINDTFITTNGPIVTNSSHVGGLVGNNEAVINDVYATGKVSSEGDNTVGGLVGYAPVNPLTGSLYYYRSGNISNAFWDKESSGQPIGNGSGQDLGMSGKTSAEMKQLNTFNTNTDWSISDTGGSTSVWRIYDGFHAPLLRSFLSPLTITADNTSKTYNGKSDSVLSNASYSIMDAPGSGHLLNMANPYNGAINVGNYNPTGLYSDQQGYDISFVNALLAISPAPLSYTADISNRLYGATNPLFTGLVTGFVGADTLTSATTGTASFTSSATNTSNVGSYAILGSGLAANNGNYLLIQASGNATALGITPATLTYTANPSNRLYGATTPLFTGLVTGFVVADTLTSATTGTASFTSNATSTSNVGNYAILGSGLAANNGNYVFTQAVGNANALTITPAPLSITANDALKNFDGAPYSGGNGITTTGLVNNETIAVLTGFLKYGGTSQGAIDPGTYTIRPYGLTSDNYAITFNNGILRLIAGNPNTPKPGTNDNIIPLVISVTDNNTGSTQQQAAAQFDEPPEINPELAKTTIQDFTNDFTDQSADGSGNNPFFMSIFSQDTKKPPILPTLQTKNSAGRVKRLQLSANKQFLSLLLEDGSVRVWDFQRGVQRQPLQPDKASAFTDISAVDSKGDRLSVAGKTGIDTHDIISLTLDDRLAIHEPDVNQFMTSNNGDLLLVNAGDNQLSLWDGKQNKLRWQTPNKRGVVHGLAIADDNHYGAVLSHQPGAYVLPTNLHLGSLTDAVDIIDMGTGKVAKALPHIGEQVLSIHFKDNDTLQLRLANGEVLDWPIAGGKPKTVGMFAETVTAVDSDQGAYAYVLKDGTVRVGDGQGHIALSIINEKNPFTYAKLLESDKKLLTVMANGELSIWDIGSGKKMLRLFSTAQGWTVMDAYGRFDGSEQAMENFSWLANEDNIPLDNFSENYYEPGLLGNVMQNRDYLNNNPSKVLAGINLPPKLILQMAGQQQTKDDSVALQLDVYDRGGGIDKVNIYHNGKILDFKHVVTRQQIQQESEAEHRVLQLNVMPIAGANTLKVIASNNMGIENSSTELRFDGKTKAYAATLRLLTIGIDQYSDAKLDLDFSVSDADAITQAIKSNSKIITDKTLYNEQATKPKILAELKELSQGVQQDVLVIYFAGHGMALGKEWYFLPYETKLQPTLEKIAATGITATELSDIFKDSRIQHILLMVDSCYSGAGLDAFSNLQNGQRHFTRQLSRSLGITVIAAAAKDQEAFELKSLGHGLFTYLMTQELQNKNTAQALTAHGIAENIVKTLPAFSKKMLGVSQDPSAFTRGNDFLLTDLSKE